jgi:long-chain acyl-CoA synthetase
MTQLADYSSTIALSQVWQQAANRCRDVVALYDPHQSVQLTYRELYERMGQLAAGLQALGIAAGAKVALFADNSPRWFIADQGSMLAGAANVVRSSQAEREELLYILEDSDSQALIAEDLKTLYKLQPELDSLPIFAVVLLSDETPPPSSDRIQFLNFNQLLELGRQQELQPVSQNRETLATLIYTSGTTGRPKGAMLSHGNLLHQVNSFITILQPTPGNRVLSILPSWHAYERSCEYYLLSQGCTLIYTSIRTFKADLKKFQPKYMVGVPRLWESLYEGIQKNLRDQPEKTQKIANFFFKQSEKYILAKRIADNLSLDHFHASSGERLAARLQALALAPLHWLGDRLVYRKVREGTGGHLQTLISGGGSLARHLDNFYEIINITVLVGYGLTETSPVTNVRTPDHNLRYSSGRPIAHTENLIVDLDSKTPLPPEQRGLILLRGPQIMQGYYKKPEATAKAIDPDGWFDSGDLGWITTTGDLVITGRAKDTIVLSNGENIEPQPIEDACVRSLYIDQIMLVGQDQKALGALIVPNLDTLSQWVKTNHPTLQVPSSQEDSATLTQSDLYSKPILDLFKQELNREVKNRPGYRADDQIKTFRLILEPFSQANGTMTQTLKIKRPVVTERYRDMIDGMFDK